jgi:hypothetical protein
MSDKKLLRKQKREAEEYTEWCEENRANYKHGFLTEDQIKSLESLPNWHWKTPDYIKIKAFRMYTDGVCEEIKIDKNRPYGLPGQYKIKFLIDISKIDNNKRKQSVIMIVKNEKVFTTFQPADKCQHKGCDCETLCADIIVK